ncbi:dihydrodipicolinate synthase family protein [Nocardioides sp. LHG3406-4]|uniref:dihydrodipicolinate synthase family protein n=1 Tax=Nocardioides sp. LHG3406-4 TaxID=2804575 RepID=UPI003CEB1EDD
MTHTPLERGLWVVLATPFGTDDDVDHGSLRRQVHLAEQVGAAGLVALGVFGEAASLSSAEHAAVLATVTAATTLPVVVGLPARTTAVAVEQARGCIGAATRPLRGLMVQAHSPRPELLIEHLHAIHDATGADVVLQDYPVVSGVHVTPAALLETVAACPFVIAVKAESTPTAPSVAALTAGTALPVFGGLGGVGLVDELACGAAGAMTGFSHPEALRTALTAYDDGGFAAARAAWAPWLPLANFEGQVGIGLALRKAILYRRGVLATRRVRPPAPGVPPLLEPVLAQHLSTLPSTQEVS